MKCLLIIFIIFICVCSFVTLSVNSAAEDKSTQKLFIKNDSLSESSNISIKYKADSDSTYTEKSPVDTSISVKTTDTDSLFQAITDSLILIKQTQEKTDSTISGENAKITLKIETLKEKIHFPMGDISFADTVVLYDPGALGIGTGDEPDTMFQRSDFSLGLPDCNSEKDSGYVSLGKGGTLVLKFTDNVLIDGPGPDLYVHEVNSKAEDTFVWISQDGLIFIPIGIVSKQNHSIDIGPYSKPGAIYPFVKLRDDPDQAEQNDPALGSDIDAVGALNTAIRIVIPSDQLFDHGTARLSNDAKEILSKIADQIRLTEHAIVKIESHTDSNGSHDFNFLISYQQASIFRNYLLDIEHLTNVDYSIRGLGETKPIVSNETEEGRRKNRRVEILIQAK